MEWNHWCTDLVPNDIDDLCAESWIPRLNTLGANAKCLKNVPVCPGFPYRSETVSEVWVLWIKDQVKFYKADRLKNSGCFLLQSKKRAYKKFPIARAYLSVHFSQPGIYWKWVYSLSMAFKRRGLQKLVYSHLQNSEQVWPVIRKDFLRFLSFQDDPTSKPHPISVIWESKEYNQRYVREVVLKARLQTLEANRHKFNQFHVPLEMQNTSLADVKGNTQQETNISPIE